MEPGRSTSGYPRFQPSPAVLKCVNQLMSVKLGRRRIFFPARGACASLTLLAVVLATLPIPLPSRRVSTDSPYPCQNRPCGCATAAQCWTSCCCTTPQERLAWAEQHGVAPPDDAVMQAPDRSPSRLESQAVGGNCCAPHGADNGREADCRATAQEAAGPSDPNSRVADQKDDPSPDANSGTFVLSMAAMRCQGGYSPFVSLPWGILDSRDKAISYPDPLIRRWSPASEVANSTTFQPDPPPPR